MNKRRVLGSGKPVLNVALWVFAAAEAQ